MRVFTVLYNVNNCFSPSISICHFARAVKGVDLKSIVERRVGSSPAGDELDMVLRTLYLRLLPTSQRSSW